MTLEVIFVFFR